MARGDSILPSPKHRGFLLHTEELEGVLSPSTGSPWTGLVLGGSIKNVTRTETAACHWVRGPAGSRRRGQENKYEKNTIAKAERALSAIASQGEIKGLLRIDYIPGTASRQVSCQRKARGWLSSQCRFSLGIMRQHLVQTKNVQA